jgi:uncharacterized protein (TIGR02266 family)
VDRARRRELKHAGVLAARQARVDLAATIATLEDVSAQESEAQELAGRLAFAVAALFGAEVGEPEGVRDRLREASGVLSGVLARLSEPGIARPLDDAGSSIAKCLAVLYPARAGLERDLEAATDSETSGDDPLSTPMIELPARDARASFAGTESSPAMERVPREKKTTSPGVAPPSSPVIPITELTSTVPRRFVRPPSDPRDEPVRVSARTLIRGGESEPAPPLAPVAPRKSDRPSDPAEAAIPLAQRRKRRNALELVPDADEGLVERGSGSPLVEGDERRGGGRHALSADIGLHSATQFFTGLTGDVSRGGIFVATWAPLPLGTDVTIAFVLPGGHQVTAPGRVAWLKEAQSAGEGEDSPGMGISFTSLSAEDRQAIERFLARRPALFHES